MNGDEHDEEHDELVAAVEEKINNALSTQNWVENREREEKDDEYLLVALFDDNAYLQFQSSTELKEVLEMTEEDLDATIQSAARKRTLELLEMEIEEYIGDITFSEQYFNDTFYHTRLEIEVKTGEMGLGTYSQGSYTPGWETIYEFPNAQDFANSSDYESLNAYLDACEEEFHEETRDIDKILALLELE